MESNAIKARELMNSITPVAKTGEDSITLKGHTVSFNDLIQMSGAKLKGGLNALIGHTSLASVPDTPPGADASDTSKSGLGDNGDHDVAHADGHEDSSDRGEDRFESHRTDGRDDRDSPQDTGRGRDTVQSDKPDQGGQQARRDDHGQNDDHGAKADDGAGSDTPEAPGNGENGSGEDQTAGSDTNDSAGETAANAAAANGAANGADQQQAENVLASVLGNAQNTALPQQAAQQAANATQANGGKENAVDGISTALNNTGKQAAASANPGNHGPQHGQAQQTPNGANANMAAQGDAQAQAQNAALGNATAASDSRASQQAAQMSQMVGDGNKVNVTVNVSDESSTLVSKPGSTLSASTVGATDTSGQSKNGQQGQHGQNAPGMNPMVQQAAQQAGGGNAQNGQAQAQALQAAGGAEGKGPMQAAVQANSNAQPLQAGGEQTATAGTNSTTETQQTQQSQTAAKTATPQHSQQARQAVLDQVSVQITKAINAGMDKINIQLKPESMGRIDVQIEMTKDGQMTAVVTADNKDTLDLLQRDSRELERSLQAAGLDVDNDGLKFELRGQNGEALAEDNGTGGAMDDLFAKDAGGEEATLEELLAQHEPKDIISDTKVDVRA